MRNIRNFGIIAHIDHGKSTLADRLLEKTGLIGEREMRREQILDDNPLERERGITIKLRAARLTRKAKDGEEYVLNLIDTPGHVDFTYEVSRSLAACEGALLVVDAAQGVEAQTISNLYLAIDADLEIIPIINKIDLPSAQANIENVKKQIVDLLGCDESEIILASAKQGIGAEEILDAIIERIPPPKGDPNAPLRALIYDSLYDPYKGVIANVRILDGTVKPKDKILFMATGKKYEVEEVGVMKLNREKTKSLSAGEVGYIAANVRNINDSKVGDTITLADSPCETPIEGFKEVKPMVFSGLYPSNPDDFESLREALGKLALNDSAITYEPETSNALGFGFRCGFLGLLHMEIVQERLEREFDQDLVTTAPNVKYKAAKPDGEEYFIENPSQMPEGGTGTKILEPYIKAQIIAPSEFIGPIMKLCVDRRGEFKNQTYLSAERVDLQFELPLAETVFDFYDKLKSISRGYASFDYEFLEYRESDVVKLDILINGEKVDALSAIAHRERAFYWGRKLASKLKELIPRQMFDVAIQAAIGSKIIARTNVKALRKDVTAKCYGGDITRKRKLLEKQKAGKKRMKQIGKVELPQEAFLAALKVGD